MAESPSKKNQAVNVSAPARTRAAYTTPTANKYISERALNRAVEKAADLTNWNDHNEAVRTFTKLFKYDDLTQQMNTIKREHERIGSMPHGLRQQRNDIIDELFSRITKDYGEEVARKVNRGL